MYEEKEKNFVSLNLLFRLMEKMKEVESEIPTFYYVRSISQASFHSIYFLPQSSVHVKLGELSLNLTLE